MSCDIDSAAAGTCSEAVDTIICWKESSMDGTDFTSISGEKDPVKPNFIFRICFLKILAALTRTIASQSKLSDIYLRAWLTSWSNAKSVRFDAVLTSLKSTYYLMAESSGVNIAIHTKWDKLRWIQMHNIRHLENCSDTSLGFNIVDQLSKSLCLQKFGEIVPIIICRLYICSISVQLGKAIQMICGIYC